MVQVLEQEDFGGRLGSALGEGTAGLLQTLIQNKLKAKAERQKLAQLQSILGGADVPGGDTEVDFLDESVQRKPTQGISNEQILAISQIDPNMAKLLQSQKESGTKEAASQFKETKETRKDILNQAKASRENDMRLDRMEQLNESGKLVSGLYNDMLKTFGIDFAALKNPESQEFEKLSTDMLRNAREIFGSRISNLEVSTFLKTIPTLSQTAEGRKRVIRNLKLLNKGAGIRLNEMKKIMKENKGVPPYDLAEQIEERIGPQLDDITEEFKVAPVTPSQAFKTLPSASDHSGKIIRDTTTGKRYKSDGKKWKVVK